MKRLGSRLLILLIVGGLAALAWWTYGEATRVVRYRPGVTAKVAPRQGPAAITEPWTTGDYRLTATASFEMEGRLLSRSRYRFDRQSDLAPIDLMLGWEVMSDQVVIDEFSFSQRNRWGFWRSPSLPVTEDEVNTHTANIHIIPATAAVRDRVLDLQRGQLIHLQGQLVNVTDLDDGWEWKTSTSRSDTGNGACEILWLTNVDVLSPP